jgi:hypothetical protein
MKTREELNSMSVVELRTYAKEVGLKNAKKFVKNELIDKILSMNNEEDKEVIEIEDASTFEVEEPTITEEASVPETDTTEAEAVEEQVTEEQTEAPVQEEPKKKTRTNKRKGTHISKPIGEQSLRIYNTMVEHPTWTHYKIKSIIGCTYTNVRRVYLNYIKGTEHDKR